MTILLGLDPGSYSTGWCRVSVSDGSPTSPRTVTFLTGGNVASTAIDLVGLIALADGIVIEKLEGYAFTGSGKGGGVVAGLVASASIAGLIAGLAFGKGKPIIELTAKQWRTTVLGNGSATDAMIKRVIPTLIRQFPKRSNVHIRDAAGVALGSVWARKWAGVRIRREEPDAAAPRATGS